MNIIIYNINSFGGNYEYVKCIFKAYSNHADVRKCILLMPSNSSFEGINVKKILLADIINSKNKWIKKIYFLYRCILNPIKLFIFLKNQESATVLFNDFDQYTATFWAPLLRFLKNKHHFGVYLHDPDRDSFFSITALSSYTMKSVMSFMDIALYHGCLPDKKYYNGNFLKIKIPHGIYTDTAVDIKFANHITALAKGNPIIGVIGNIRDEKNYELIFDALCFIKDIRLLIAGQPANSGVAIDYYKDYVEKKNVADRIIWIIEYLPIAAFNAAIQSCEIILLCYKPSFKSQSGILNSVAPFKKKIIITDTHSSLKESVQEFNLGMIIPHNNPNVLATAILKLLALPVKDQQINWEKYMIESSWEKHVEIAVNAFKKMQK